MILRPPPPGVPSSSKSSAVLRRAGVVCAAVGIGAGLLNGLLGAAGGILLVLLLPKLPLKQAFPASPFPGGDPPHPKDVLTTSMAVMLPVSAVSTLLYYAGGIRPDPALLSSLILPAAAGGMLGAVLLGRIPDRLLRRGFALLVTVSGLRMLT